MADPDPDPDPAPALVGADALAATDARPPRRRRSWVWLVVAAVLVLVAAGVVVAETAARGQLEETVREGVRELLAADPAQPVRVEISGVSVLGQVATGRLESVTASADDVTIGELAGDLEISLIGIPVDPVRGMADPDAAISGPVEEARVRFAATADTVTAVVTGVTLSAVREVSLAEGSIHLASGLDFFGLRLDIELDVVPVAQGGAIAFEPLALTVNDTTLTVPELRAQFGALADVIFQPRTHCLASSLPEGVTVANVAVTPDAVIVDLEAQQFRLDEAGLTARGTCAE